MKSIVKIDPLLHIEDTKDVLNFPVIARVTRFDANGLADLQDDISAAHETGQPVVPIVIDSFGGEAYTCIAMISAIQNSRIPVATIVTGKAMSAGAVLFGFGTEGFRFMDANAILMLHDIADDPEGKLEDLKVDVKHLEYLNQTIYKRMAKHVGQPDDYFLQLIKKTNHLDLYLTGKEAKKHKLANHIRVPTLELNVKVEYKFI